MSLPSDFLFTIRVWAIRQSSRELDVEGQQPGGHTSQRRDAEGVSIDLAVRVDSELTARRGLDSVNGEGHGGAVAANGERAPDDEVCALLDDGVRLVGPCWVLLHTEEHAGADVKVAMGLWVVKLEASTTAFTAEPAMPSTTWRLPERTERRPLTGPKPVHVPCLERDARSPVGEDIVAGRCVDPGLGGGHRRQLPRAR